MATLERSLGLPRWALLAIGGLLVLWLVNRRRDSLQGLDAATPIATNVYASTPTTYPAGTYPYGYYQQPAPWASPESQVWGGRTFSSEPEDVRIVGTLK